MTEFGLDGFAARLPYGGVPPQPESGAASRAAHKGDHTPAEQNTSSMLSATASAGDALRPAGPPSMEMSPMRRTHRNRLVGGSAILAALVAAAAIAGGALAGNRGGSSGGDGGAPMVTETSMPPTPEATTLPPYTINDYCPDPTATEPKEKRFEKRIKPPKYIDGDLAVEIGNNAPQNGLTPKEAWAQVYTRQLKAIEQKLDWAAGFSDQAKAEAELQTVLEGQGDAGDDYTLFRPLTDIVLACVQNHTNDPERQYRIRLAVPDTDAIYGGGVADMHAENVVMDIYRLKSDDRNVGELAASYNIGALQLGPSGNHGGLAILPIFNLDKPLDIHRRD
jgi:hypothetical protein